ncbi:PAS domain S-box-containing protein [Hymenobacter sp. UYAg731]
MTHAELEEALAQQKTANAHLRAQLAELAPYSTAAYVPPSLLAYLLEEQYTAVVMADAEGRVQWVNNGFTKLCGLTMSELAGQKPEKFLRPHLCDEATVAYIRGSMQRHEPFQYEVANPRPGSDGWLRVSVRPVAADGVVHFVGMLEDITEWKRVQLQLVASERRFRALAENVPGVLYEWRKKHDGAYFFDYVSPKVQELFGIAPHELSRMTDFIHPDELEGFLQSLDFATRNHTSWEYEGRIVVPGQPVRWLRGNSNVTGSGPDWVTYSGILLDVTPLKLAESALREGDLRLGLAVEGFGDGAWELNLRTHQISFSSEYKAMLGYDDAGFPDEYEVWLAHIHPHNLDQVLEAVRQYIWTGGKMVTGEYRMRCQDGNYKWVLNRAVITAWDTNGNPLMLSGLQSDISAQKDAEEALHTSNRQLATVIAHFQDGLVLEDENRRIVFTNEAFCRLLETPVAPARLHGRDGAWLTEGSRKYVRKPHQYVARIAALLRRRQPATGDIIPLRDGRTLQRAFTPIFDGSRYVGHLWKYEDITARIKAEEDLKRREEKYRGIIENMSLGLVEADLNDHLLYANHSFCDMTGYCTDELAGQRLSPLLLSGPDLELVESKLRNREHGISDSYEIVVTTKTGERKWLLVSGAPLYDEHQRHIGSIGIYLDVTVQKHLETSLREAKVQAESSTRAKQDFLANMSHEIRTPMNAILGMSQLLAKTPLAAPQASYLHAITASAENLLVIINDILDLSKIEAGQLAIEHIGFSPGSICAQVKKTLQYKAEEKGLTFIVSLDPALPEVVLGDPFRLTQVLLNLAGNSVKFTEQGTVRVSCQLLEHPNPDEVLAQFTVEDTGIGIETQYLKHIFDDFSQEDSTVTRRFGGTGLGLGISNKLVLLLGGELCIESRKNHGTTSRFTLRLPVGDARHLAPKDHGDPEGLQQELRGKRILLVEDNLFNRMLATSFLANAGLRVTEAPNGQAAIELAGLQVFDLILMDVQMPIKNGYEATRILRQELGLTVPIIALTANAITGEREKCLAAGMNDYLSKPFQEFSLLKMVHDWAVAAPRSSGH